MIQSARSHMKAHIQRYEAQMKQSMDQFLDEIVKELEHMEQENKLLELRNQMLLDRMARDGVSLSEEDKK